MPGIERHRLRWIGRADAVSLVSFMPRFPGHLPLTLTDDGDWYVDIFLPDTARIEYRIAVTRGSDVETTLDPANPQVATNPFGSNSVLTGTAYRPTPRTPSITWKRAEFRVRSTAFPGRRHHHLLSPEGIADGEPLPLLCLHDGTDWLRHGALEDTLGAAIAAGTVPFMRVALLDPRARNREYVADPSHAAHVATEVLPHVERRVRVSPQRIVGGASLGAVASWHTAWSHPGTFTGLVLQSGTFAFSRHPELPPPMAAPIRDFLDAAVADPRIDDMGVGQSCGRYESLVDWNRRVAAVLEPEAVAHHYEERWAGHDWGAWSDTLIGSLTIAFSGRPHPDGPHL